MSEQRILYAGLERLSELTGLNYDVLNTEVLIEGRIVDVLVSIGSGRQMSLFNVEVGMNCAAASFRRF